MKLLNKIRIASLSVILVLLSFNGFSQAAEKGDVNIAINYFITNNSVPRLMVKVNTKVNGKFLNVAGISVKLFLDKDSTGTFIGNVVTNEKGEATIYIPTSVKSEWNTSIKHTFLATFAGNKKYESAKADLTVAKAKILIDAGSDKTVTATVYEMKDTTWTPAKGVDVILALKRLGADLNINETPTFSTDSTGKASGDFKRDSIPGDANGNIILVAKIVDNDNYGNLSIQKVVPWGAKFTSVSVFNKRTLFATRGKAPIWLIVVSSAIIIAVWGVLIMLVFNIIRIKKLGQEV
ncbi:hypothetical protein JN11_03098 [Mucilaginibacter frigoritolerans]|uniref:Uncharacterized protein n=1 Tax=Mucilaginibacter frigoritolerans TaxID=652788 RepID=A0A562TZ16_9SPHI|nr:hypothetical protein [Mucilaginibacter frigoritolerans]TWI98020.1 hypothetical protein JN11_03098 [Mucilaginibacter frigoritolerans]